MKTKIILLIFSICLLFSCKKDNDDKKPEKALWKVVIEQGGNYQMFDRMFQLSGANMGLDDVDISIDYLGTKYEAILWSTLGDNFPENQKFEINITNPISGIAVQYTITALSSAEDEPEIPEIFNMSATISVYCNGELYTKATNTLSPNVLMKKLTFACNYGFEPNIVFTMTDGDFNIWMEDIDGNPIPLK